MTYRNIFVAFFLVFLLTASSGFAATSSTETTSEYMEDSVITTKVKAALMEESTLKTLDIKIVTEMGVVTMSGTVPTQASISKAGEIAKGVKGVKSIKNNLTVR